MTRDLTAMRAASHVDVETMFGDVDLMVRRRGRVCGAMGVTSRASGGDAGYENGQWSSMEW